MVEAWERTLANGTGRGSPDEVARLFDETFRTAIDQLAASSEVPPEAWRAAQGGREGRDWWADNGPRMVAQYVEQNGPDRGLSPIVVAGGVLGLELAGTLMVGKTKGYPGRAFEYRIDQLMVANGDAAQLVLRDLKFGSHMPGHSSLQLPAYRYAAGLVFGADLDPLATWTGHYWNGRKGIATEPQELRLESAGRRLYAALGALERARAAHAFTPNPTNMCSACPFSKGGAEDGGPLCPAFRADGRDALEPDGGYLTLDTRSRTVVGMMTPTGQADDAGATPPAGVAEQPETDAGVARTEAGPVG